MNIQKTRKEYIKGSLTKRSANSNPFIQFREWYDKADNSGIDIVNAMTLATTGEDGFPSARIVLLKEFDEQGFVFFTNYNSRKASEIESSGKAALLIFWKELERQVRIEGFVEKTTAEESDEYFLLRPEESRISAIVSRQSEVVPDRKHLESIRQQYKTALSSRERPNYWGGYRLKPVRLEFWQGRENRLHDRLLYSIKNNRWEIDRLAP